MQSNQPVQPLARKTIYAHGTVGMPWRFMAIPSHLDPSSLLRRFRIGLSNGRHHSDVGAFNRCGN